MAGDDEAPVSKTKQKKAERHRRMLARRQVKDQSKSVLLLIQHVFDTLPTSNERRAFLSAVRRFECKLRATIPPGNVKGDHVEPTPKEA